MRYLCIDLGDKRTGLAVSDAFTRIVSPVDVLEVPSNERGGAALLEAIAKAVRDHVGDSPYAKGELVLGLPLNMDGTEGPRAKMVREWAGRIADMCGRVVHLQDERLSSADADWQMAQSGLTHKQKKLRRDALAAATVLQEFLTGMGQEGRPEPIRPSKG